MAEIWKEIDGWEGIYQVSNYGRLKSFKGDPQGNVLSNVNKTGGYFSVVLCFRDKKRYVRMHRLVAEAFLFRRNRLLQINHKDGDKQNNKVENLEWVTPRENMLHAARTNPSFLSGMKRYNQTKGKNVLQISLGGTLIEKFKHAADAARHTGVCVRNIHQVASKTEYKPGLFRKQAGGFRWEYA